MAPGLLDPTHEARRWFDRAGRLGQSGREGELCRGPVPVRAAGLQLHQWSVAADVQGL